MSPGPGAAARYAAIAAGACLIAAAPRGPTDPAATAGAYELSLEGSHRKCRIVLDAEAAGLGRVLRFPAGCRRALAILSSLSGWTVPAGGRVIFLDKEGRPALAFEAPDDGEAMLARTSNGEAYRLQPADSPVREARRPLPPAPGVPQPTPVDPDKAPRPDTLPGTYAVDRYTEREVCRVALGPAMLDASGRFEARLLEGCRDEGLAVFDPVAWRYDGGRLKLIARRGHEVTLVSERDGVWRRDPEVGATLMLRKAP